MNQEILTIPAELPKTEQRAILNTYFDKFPAPDRGNPVLKAIGALGRLIHGPLYSFFKSKTAKLTGRSVFYDSVLFGMLMYLYPTIVTILSVILGLIGGWPVGLGVFFGLPLLALVGARYR
jgi:1-acyl-sn-glycerol-3-phosphate acyltransferase